MFNWLSVKKFVFASVIACSAIGPAYFLQTIDKDIFDNSGDPSVLDFKKDFLKTDGTELFTGTKYKSFLEELLKTEYGRDKIRKFFVSFLSLLWHEQQGESKNRQELITWETEEESEYQTLSNNSDNKSNEQINVFDKNGGTRESTRKNFLSKKTYESFKELLTTFFDYNFTIKKDAVDKNALDSFFIKSQNYISQTDIETSTNWEKIGFYPTLSKSSSNASDEEKKYLIGKFHFLNWAYKKWYAETLPFYTWMVLWKHSGTDLSSKYVLDEIQNEKIKTQPNYNLPLFSDIGDKFKNFLSVIKKDTDANTKPFVSRSYTDDSATTILVQAADSHSKLYPEFASAANYKFHKSIKGENTDFESCLNGEQPNVANNIVAETKINEITESDYQNLTDPLDIFLLKPDVNAAKQTTPKGHIYIDKSIIKNGVATNVGQAQHYTLYDAREVENKDWMFLRNTAGAHAIMVDHAKYSKQDNNGCKIKKAFEHFNFRNLQLIHKSSLNLTNTVDVGSDNGLNQFKLYLNSNFDQLIIKYLFSNNESKKYLFNNINDWNYLESFKKLLMLWDEMDFYQKKHFVVHDLRKKIIQHYASRGWDKSTDDLTIADKKEGLSGSFPYSYGTDADKYLFSDHEKLFENIKYADATENETLLIKYEKLLNKLSEEIQSLFKDIRLSIENKKTDFLKSERIFFNDWIINNTYDELLDNKDLIDIVTKTLFLQKSHNSYIKSALFDTNVLDEKTLLFKTENAQAPSAVNNASVEWYANLKTSESIKNSFKQFLFSGYLYDKQSKQNWFDSLVYAKYSTTNAVGTNTSEKIANFVMSNAENAFKENYFFINKNLKKIYLDFLIAFNYLTRDGYENMRKILEKKTENYSDTFFVFKKNTTTFEENKANLFSNPFLNNYDATNTHDFQFKNSTELNSLISYQFTHTANKTPATKDLYNFSGISIFNEKLSVNALTLSEKIINDKNLFTFNNKAELIKYISECSEENFEKLIKRMHKKGFDVSIIKKKFITFDDDSSKDLTLQHRKNALTAFVNNYKMPTNDEKLTDDKSQRIFGTKKTGDDTEFTSKTEFTTTTDANYLKNIQDTELQRITKDDTDATKDYYVVQYNKNDITDENKFKTFLNAQLNEKSFANIFFNILNESDTLKQAEEDFFKKITQIKVFDKKTKEALNENFVVKKTENKS